MSKISEILQKIEDQKIGTILRIWEWDIDIYSEKILEIKRFFTHLGATLFYEDSSKVRYYFFIDEKRITFDIEKNFDYISELFFSCFSAKSDISLSEYSSKKIMFDTLRYLFAFRAHKKTFFSNNFSYLIENNFFLDCLNKKIFRKNIRTQKELFNFLRKDFFTLMYFLRFKYFILFYLHSIYFHGKIIIKRVFSNNTYAILWYDGSWKSTISEVLHTSFWVKCIYMWYRRFASRGYYKLLDSNNFFKLLRLFCMFLDFWLLYVSIFYYSIRYEFVIFDRHPKCEVYPHSSLAEKAIKCIFYLYPSPKKNFILYNTPEVILSRKKERTTEEILKLNDYIESTLSKQRKNIVIKNDIIDDTLNTILKNIYS